MQSFIRAKISVCAAVATIAVAVAVYMTRNRNRWLLCHRIRDNCSYSRHIIIIIITISHVEKLASRCWQMIREISVHY